MVLAGELTIKMEGGDVVLGAGDTYVVPRGSLHQPVAGASGETSVLLFEPSATVNTGDSPRERARGRRSVL